MRSSPWFEASLFCIILCTVLDCTYCTVRQSHGCGVLRYTAHFAFDGLHQMIQCVEYTVSLLRFWFMPKHIIHHVILNLEVVCMAWQ